MKLSLQLKAIILGIVSGLAAIGIAFAAGEMFQRSSGASAATGDGLAIPATGTLEQKGYTLFMMNCAHCHGTDARGEEGPDLHGVTKSDARIASLIRDGKKGEMPKFNSKLSDADVQALVAFIRSLMD
ncbi:MAG TPA: cytochrome c [Candidatus Saccharimonadales bacterium]|nr:cytochrome c [Candidatus Saccharimonadales bacterium]